MSSIETKKITGTGVRAQAHALFIRDRQAEFDQLHGDMRVAAGLSRQPIKAGGTSPVDRMDRLQKRMIEMQLKEQELLNEIANGK